MAVILIKTPPTIGFPTDIEFLSIFQGFVVSYQRLHPLYIFKLSVMELPFLYPVMAHHHNFQAMFFYHMLIAPLIPTPTNAMERKINKLRVKYRIYMVEMDVEYVSLKLNIMF
ncbi:hypothetical protein MtrunA17_Chr3g0083241 [Medicago truncatula]|uniref:Uncharacterized protein n=1 Tax=Medicago truncatula TaxID=3880 RepID=A0A396ILP0_MEDTR|nr:hypothetical protein MtrunA17_Chr3g0083241 [Medicago truncatula]